MMKRLIAIQTLTAGLLVAPSFANVDPKVHKLCVEAKDYLGCVKAMKGESLPSKDSGVGNRCAAGFAYVGGNKECQKVGCKYRWWMFAGGMKNDPLVAGKSSWSCPDQWSGGTLNKGVLTLNEVGPIEHDPNCPPIAPEIGWNNSCESAPPNWQELEAEKARSEGPKCDFKLKPYDCSYDKYLEGNPAIRKWAELNPDMAAKERIKLQSID